MNNTMKKAGMSMLSGAACALGSWITTLILNKGKDAIDKHFEEKKEEKGSA